MNGQPVTQKFNLGYDADCEACVVSVAGINGTNYTANFTYRCNGKSRGKRKLENIMAMDKR